MKAKYFKTWAKAQTEVYSAMVIAMETAVDNIKYSDDVKTSEILDLLNKNQTKINGHSHEVNLCVFDFDTEGEKLYVYFNNEDKFISLPEALHTKVVISYLYDITSDFGNFMVNIEYLIHEINLYIKDLQEGIKNIRYELDNFERLVKMNEELQMYTKNYLQNCSRYFGYRIFLD